MDRQDVWAAIHGERKALAADLDTLTDDAWETPSLCGGWTVRDVVAHMTATARMKGAAQFFPRFIGSGFSLQRLQAKDIERERGSSPADALAGFKSQLDSTSGPPGPTDTMLGETVVHAEDIRRALGISHEYPAAVLTEVADFYKRSNLILGTKKRIAGVSLQATDTGWQHGTGATVSGPMLSLVMAMTGRKDALADLTGEGVETLRSRA